VMNETSGMMGENSRAARRFAAYSAGRHFTRANRDGPRASGDKAYSGNGSATRSSEPQAENGRVERKGSAHAATMIMFSFCQSSLFSRQDKPETRGYKEVNETR
jgi:hypothetical protein